jgi:uncharacterized membrane protein YkgB
MCLTSKVAPLSRDFDAAELVLQDPVNRKPTCCGKKIVTCDSTAKKTFFIIATLIGAILLILGLLALAGYFAPSAGGGVATVLQKLNTAATFVASSLGSDLFTISILAVSIGGACALGGAVGLCVNRCQNHAKATQEFNNSKEQILSELQHL